MPNRWSTQDLTHFHNTTPDDVKRCIRTCIRSTILRHQSYRASTRPATRAQTHTYTHTPWYKKQAHPPGLTLYFGHKCHVTSVSYLSLPLSNRSVTLLRRAWKELGCGLRMLKVVEEQKSVSGFLPEGVNYIGTKLTLNRI